MNVKTLTGVGGIQKSRKQFPILKENSGRHRIICICFLGVLLAKRPPKGQRSNPRLVLTDAIPLFHQTEGLSPMVEVALAQIENKTASIGLIIAGYYHANRLFKGKD